MNYNYYNYYYRYSQLINLVKYIVCYSVLIYNNSHDISLFVLSHHLTNNPSLIHLNLVFQCIIIRLRSRTGKKLAKSTFVSLITNPVYASRGRTKMVKGEYKGRWKPIVSLKVFEAVQERISGISKSFKIRQKDEFYLNGLIYCEKCGRSMLAYYAAGRGGRKYTYFKCGKCNGQNIKLSEMHSEFEALRDRMRFDPDYYEELCEMIRVELFSMGAEAAKERECSRIPFAS